MGVDQQSAFVWGGVAHCEPALKHSKHAAAAGAVVEV